MAQQPRRRLADVDLTGWRRGARLLLLLSAVGAAALCLMTLPFEEHTVSYVHVESLLSETSGTPFVFALMILAVTVWAVRGGFPRGLLAGAVTTAGAFITAVAIAFQHLLTDPIYNTTGSVALLCIFALFLLGPAIFVAEVVLYWLERRRLEATDPVFATARVVSH
jgi:hypothetical protein